MASEISLKRYINMYIMCDGSHEYSILSNLKSGLNVWRAGCCSLSNNVVFEFEERVLESFILCIILWCFNFSF